MSTQGSLMDSPHLVRLCFLLLTIAAPRPSIAMPGGNHAEGTQDSSFSTTQVTVHRCEDCESDVCDSPDYEGFKKIGETQDQKFSNEIIQLVTNETHIVMCFLQENTSLEGVYAISWVKTNGIGDSCGSLNAGGSLENVRDATTKICCEAKTDPSAPSPQLKCSIKISDEKTGKATANVTSDHHWLWWDNPQYSVGEKSSFGVIPAVLILAVFAAGLALCWARRNRNSRETAMILKRGPVVMVHQFFNADRNPECAPDTQNLAPL